MPFEATTSGAVESTSTEITTESTGPEPLATLGDVERWLQLPAGQLDGDAFATDLLLAVSERVRFYGSADWTPLNVPYRAKVITILKVRHFYRNPDVLQQESTGPLNETKVRGLGVVHNITFEPEEQSELALLAGKTDPHAQPGGLWIQPVDHGTDPIGDDFYVTDQSGSDWMIPFVRLGDNLYPRY